MQRYFEGGQRHSSDMGMKQRQLSAGSKRITEIGLQRKETIFSTTKRYEQRRSSRFILERNIK